MAESIQERPRMFHHGEHAGGATAWAVRLGLIGVAMAAMQGVEVAGPVRRVDGHATEARLLQVVDTSRHQRVEPGGRHGERLRGSKETITMVVLFVILW